MKIARVFPTKTRLSPIDSLAYFDVPGMFDEADEVHVSTLFTWDKGRAEYLAEQWRHVAPVTFGGPAYNQPGASFVPGKYVREGAVITSRGCPNKCLRGDTIIRTTDGVFRIYELIGKQPKVLTRTPSNGLIYAKATNVRKTGDADRLVRINFDDGTHIDCTPDHLFTTFKNCNQYVPRSERETRADALKRGDSVVAVKCYIRKDGYEAMAYGRHFETLNHRLIYESETGLRSDRSRQIHHRNGNKSDNRFCNLEDVCPTDHYGRCHPEIAQRMKKKNPTQNMNNEWREKLRQNGRKGGRPASVNHRILDVVSIDGLHETFCMEVPGYDWFFANDVLVHNCWFCSVWQREPRLLELEIFDGTNILDDNLLACSERHIRAVFAMLKVQHGPKQFTGGLEANRLLPWHVNLLADLRPAQMFFALDTPDDEEPLRTASKMLRQAGFTRNAMRCYVLIGYPRDTIQQAETRLRLCLDLGFFPMAMLWRDENGIVDINWRKFQREWARPALIYKKCAAEIKEVFATANNSRVTFARPMSEAATA
jgi:hypothetical protein